MSAKQTKTRDGFASNVGAFAATLGSAIGLGNIWKFPYLTGSNGGAAFVIAYLLSVLLVGLPVLVAEHLIGRKTRLNAIHAYGSVVPRGKYWSLIGWAGFISAILIMAFTPMSPAGYSLMSLRRSGQPSRDRRSTPMPSTRWPEVPGNRWRGSLLCWS